MHVAQLSLLRGVKAYNLSAGCSVSVDSVATRLFKMRTIAELVISSLGAIEGFSELVVDCQNMYKDGCSQLCGLVHQSRGFALRVIKDSNWANFVSEMDRLKKMVESLGAHLEPHQLGDVYRSIQERVVMGWEAAVESATSVLKTRNIETDDVRSIDAVMVMLRAVSRHDGVDEHVQDGLSAKCIGRVVSCVSGHIVHVCNGLHSLTDLQLIHKKVQLVDSLRKIPELMPQTETAYQELIAALRSRISGLKESLLIGLANFSTDAFDPRQFTERFLQLQKASCFEDHPSGVFTTELEAVQEALIVFHSSLMQEMQKPLAVDQREELTSRFKCLYAVDMLDGCHSIVPALLDMAKLMHKSFASKVKTVLEESVAVFSASPLVWKDIENVLLFLMRCQELGMKSVETEAKALEVRIRQFSAEHFKALQQTWSENFQCFSSIAVHPMDVMSVCAAKLRSVCAILREMGQSYKPGKVKEFRGSFDCYTDLFQTQPAKMFAGLPLPALALRLKKAAALRHDMSKDDLFTNLQVCNALKSLDQFTSAEIPKFIVLAGQFEAAIDTLKKSVAQSIQLAVRTGRYADVVRSMADFEVVTEADEVLKRDISKELAETLRVAIAELEEEMKQDNKFETIESFCNFLGKLQRSKTNTHTVIHLLDAVPQQKLPERLVKIELSVTQWMHNKLDSLMHRMVKNDFHHCEMTLRLLEDIHRCLVESLKGDIQVKLGALKGTIAQTCTALRKRVSGVADIVAKLPLTSYSKSPPSFLFKELELCVGDDISYGQTAALLSQQISKTVRSSLDAIRGEDVDVCETQIKLIESSRNFLPIRVVALFEDHLRDFKTELHAMNESVNRQLEEDIALGNFKHMVERSMTYVDNSMNCHCDKYIAEIRKAMAAGSARFQGDLLSGNLQSVLQNFPDMFADWRYYITKISTAKKVLFIKTRWSVDKECDKYCRDMKDALREEIAKTTHEVEDEQNNWRVFNKRIDVLLYFFEFKHRDISKTDSHSHLLYYCLVEKQKEIEEGVKRAVLKVVGWCAANARHFLEALDSFDNARLRQAMELAQAAEKLHEKLEDASKNVVILRELPEFSTIFSACLSYREMQFTLGRHIMRWLDSVNQPFVNNEATKTENVLDRDRFYTALFNSFRSVKELKLLTAHVSDGFNLNDLERTFETKVRRNLEQLDGFVSDLLHQLPSDDEKTISDFNIWFDNFRSFIDNFDDPSLKAVATSLRDKTRDGLKGKVTLLLTNALDSRGDLPTVVDKLVVVKSIALSVPVCKADIDEMINGFLGRVKSSAGTCGAQRVGMLGVLLTSCKTEVAQRIINDHPLFEGYALSLRNERTLRVKVLDVLAELRANQTIDCSLLHAQYVEFEKEYWGLVEEGLLDLSTGQMNITTSVRILASTANHTILRRDKVRGLIAQTLAWWTLSQAKHYVEAMATEDNGDQVAKKSYLMQPHAAQVIAIFRLLGVDADPLSDPRSHMSNHLVQIGTGEGKSVVLAVTATVLALMGFEVYCGCYSQYLSDRDCEAFQNVFNAFAVNSFVHYGTFNKLCENFINERGDVRDVVQAAIKGQSLTSAITRPSNRQKILLIDEVDVFFNKEFYGNLYKPVAKLEDATITAFINHVWNLRGNPAALKFSLIKRSEEFASVLRRYPGWEDLIGETVKTLLQDLQTFESQDYVVINGRVGYKEQDAISFDVVNGYKTLFVHYKECAARTVTRSALLGKIALYIECGNFSYAEVPKGYLHVMGVSGTLEALSAPKKRLLAETYNIRKHTFVASVYGASNLDFQGESTNGVRIESSAGYHNAICNEINARLKDRDGARDARAVLVFFASKTKLRDFYQSAAFHAHRNTARVMTEEVSALSREDIVRQAVTSGNVTLLTSEFGRGTDFICYDDRLLLAGGVHVLQTYVSDEVSEEAQIMGRTARQGNKGSFSMVLLDEELEKYGILSADIVRMQSTGRLYRTINEQRNRFYEVQYPKDTEYVEDIKKDHALSTQFLTSLVTGDISAVRSFLFQQNQAPRDEVEVTRTICLMDATGSMSSLLTGAKQKVKTMFANAHAILEQEGYEAAFELQFAVYRNYSSSEDQLLQNSGWASKPAELVTFMDSIGPHGGMGNEAIEVGFWHVNNEIAAGKISQVILIGDMPANSPEEVVSKRASRKGESYWRSTAKFATPVHLTDQLQKIVTAGVPIHAFYLRPEAAGMFAQIARDTRGTSRALDLNSTEDELTHLITTNILNKVGGVRGGVDHGAKLVNAYRAKFRWGYVANNGEE